MNRQPPADARDRVRRHKAWIWNIAAFLGGVGVLAGCGNNANQRYIPADDAAQQALETALTEWQSGKRPPCLVQDGPPAIQLVDTHHAADRQLTGFAILGPTPGDAHRCYAVRLTFNNPQEEVRARFVVLGLDPLWVMRYEDYEMLAHWDHPMPAKDAPAKKSDS